MHFFFWETLYYIQLWLINVNLRLLKAVDFVVVIIVVVVVAVIVNVVVVAQLLLLFTLF